MALLIPVLNKPIIALLAFPRTGVTEIIKPIAAQPGVIPTLNNAPNSAQAQWVNFLRNLSPEERNRYIMRQQQQAAARNGLMASAVANQGLGGMGMMNNNNNGINNNINPNPAMGARFPNLMAGGQQGANPMAMNIPMNMGVNGNQAALKAAILAGLGGQNNALSAMGLGAGGGGGGGGRRGGRSGGLGGDAAGRAGAGGGSGGRRQAVHQQVVLAPAGDGGSLVGTG